MGNKPGRVSGPVRTVATRFYPGQELRQGLLDLVKSSNMRAAFIMTCVGSLTKATLRMANSTTIVTYEGHFEIVSLVGTLSGGEGGHLHISLSDAEGKVVGGHVIGDLVIYTTAEVVVGECVAATFQREDCLQSGWDELVVRHRRQDWRIVSALGFLGIGLLLNFIYKNHQGPMT